MSFSINVPEQINSGFCEAVSVYQIDTTEGNSEEALMISSPKVIACAGDKFNSKEKKETRVTILFLTI
jgi:hypothetical protein